VAQGMAAIGRAGLSNIELKAFNLADIDASFGQFDYIICHGVYSWVPPHVQDAILRVCANHLAGYGIARYAGSQVSTKLKVTGVDLFSAGDFTGGKDTDEIVLADPAGGVYKKLVVRDDKLVGGVLYGDTSDGAWYFKLVRDGRSIASIRDRLVFGEANLGDTGHEGQSRAVSMANDAEVCGCNGVCKGAIVKAIKEKGLFTLEDVRKHTKASSSCGSCTGLVEQLLMATAGASHLALAPPAAHPSRPATPVFPERGSRQECRPAVLARDRAVSAKR